MSSKEEQPFLNISQHTSESQFHYDLVLQFKNPYDLPDNFYTPSFPSPSMPIKQARLLYTQLFRLDAFPSDSKPDIFSKLQDTLRSLNTLSQSKSINTSTLYQLIFHDIIMILQDLLHLRISLLYSRDYQFIFCKIKASEYNLMVHADLLNYPLQYKRNMKDYYDYMYFSPYVPFNAISHQLNGKPDNLNLYQRYSSLDSEDSNGSIFQSKDRIRLIKDMLDSGIDISQAKSCKLLLDHYPLHIIPIKNHLIELWGSWTNILKTQRMELIREYYGENLALHFSWIEYLIRWVVIPGILGISLLMLRTVLDDIDGNDDSLTASEVYLLIISVLFPIINVLILIFWKRNLNAFSHKWGIDTHSIEATAQRSSLAGTYIQHPITGRHLKIDFNTSSRVLKQVLSFFITVCFICISIVTTISLKIYSSSIDKNGWDNYAVGILNSIQIKTLNSIFQYVAVYLNDWLNYETQSDYENALILRLFVFQSVNSYGYLTYIAFWKGNLEGCDSDDCYEELTIQLTYVFIGYIILNLIELTTPILTFKIQQVYLRSKLTAAQAERYRENLSETESQGSLLKYRCQAVSYVEVLVVYGYILLFGASFPMGPVVLIVYLVLYIRIKAWIVTKIMKRPYPYILPGSKMWLDILTLMVYLGAASNLAVVFFTANVIDFDSSGYKWLSYVLSEHILISMLLLLQYSIPSSPYRNIHSAIECSKKWSQRILSEVLFNSYPTSNETLQIRNLSYEALENSKKVSSSSDKIGYIESCVE